MFTLINQHSTLKVHCSQLFYFSSINRNHLESNRRWGHSVTFLLIFPLFSAARIYEHFTYLYLSTYLLSATDWSFEIFERPMVIDSLNLNLSQISCQISDLNGFVDLRILADFQI